MKFHKNFFLSSALIIASGFSINALASITPTGEYASTSQIVSDNMINNLKSTESSVIVNDSPAIESNHKCGPGVGSRCQVELTWTSALSGKSVTSTVAWTSGTLQAPHVFDLSVLDENGHEIQLLEMIR